MESLNILVGGSPVGMRVERDAITHAAGAIRVAERQLLIESTDERWPFEQNIRALAAADVYIALCNPSAGEWLEPQDRLFLPRMEIAEAIRLKKSIVIFLAKEPGNEVEVARQKDLLVQELDSSAYPYDLAEFTGLAQLEERAANTLSAILRQVFHLDVSRPLFQAPLPLATFCGREAKRQELTDALLRGGAVVVHGLGDFGGLGKTELAITVAHELRDHFSDGVLWADIPATRPDETLMTWLRAYGGAAALGRGDLRFEFRPVPVEVRKIEETTVRADLLRDVLRGRRVLAVLDGVVDEMDNERIVPLLRGLKDCTILITSRVRHLSSLPDARPVDLDRFSQDQAWNLLTRVAGADRVAGQQAFAPEIGRLLDLTPLAVDIVASLLRCKTDWTVGELARQLKLERDQLEKVNWGYPRARGNRTALNVAHRQLDPEQRSFFAALGAFAGRDYNASAAAYVSETPFDTAQQRLEQLDGWGLVRQRYRPGRYLMHSVVRSYAREKLFDPLPNLGQRSQAESRMSNYYCGLAKEFGRKLQGVEVHTALAVLDNELSNIFAGQKWAQKLNDRAGWELCRDYISGAMTYYFSLKAMWSDWIAWSNAGIEACRRMGDEKTAAAIAASLGMVHYRKGEIDQANEFYRHALDTMEKAGNVHGLATIYMNLGNVKTQKREWNQAITYLLKSLQMRERMGDMHGQAQTRANIGALHAKRGEKDKARANWLQALEMFDHLGCLHEADIVRKWLRTMPLGDKGPSGL